MDTCVLLYYIQIHVKAPYTCTHACIILTISVAIDHTHIRAVNNVRVMCNNKFNVLMMCNIFRVTGELYDDY